ncbi:TPA: hypothetical protein ACH9RL_003311, partial [Escherichia coli]
GYLKYGEYMFTYIQETFYYAVKIVPLFPEIFGYYMMFTIMNIFCSVITASTFFERPFLFLGSIPVTFFILILFSLSLVSPKETYYKIMETRHLHDTVVKNCKFISPSAQTGLFTETKDEWICSDGKKFYLPPEYRPKNLLEEISKQKKIVQEKTNDNRF